MDSHELRYLGVVGTMIWDRILGPGDEEEPVEGWGGISYSLEAMSTALPRGWAIRPLVRLGEDLAEEAQAYLSSIPRVESWRGIQVTAGINPRVELRYRNQESRSEVPSGSVPPWDWPALEPCLEQVDALYLNFISGKELDLATARQLSEEFEGPLYADLHTLFAEISDSGIRHPRSLPDWREWFRAFDLIQVNEEEFRLSAGSLPRGQDGLGPPMDGMPALIAVTRGPEGSTYFAEEGFDPDPMSWACRRALRKGTAGGEGRPIQTGTVPGGKADFSVDPTGCGDVWGATFFARLLAGDPTQEAMRAANRLAFEKLKHRGAHGLHRLLPELSTEP